MCMYVYIYIHVYIKQQVLEIFFLVRIQHFWLHIAASNQWKEWWSSHWSLPVDWPGWWYYTFHLRQLNEWMNLEAPLKKRPKTADKKKLCTKIFLKENGGWNHVLSISWSKNLSLTIDIQRGSSCSRFACFKPSILPILSPPNHPCPLVSSQGIPKAPFLCACVTPSMPPVHIPRINSSFMLQCWNIDLPIRIWVYTFPKHPKTYAHFD